MRHLILGTAGHIDHGKTALVRALTGTDTDRLAEEKRRGITIDLGFASLDLEGGAHLGIIDVPGHEAFVRNMLAGAVGIDAVLLVVAADEGVMPQTREHLAIVELLGVRAGVVALTKTDLVEPAWLDLVVDDVRDQIRATPFAAAPIVPVSAVNGQGLDALRAALRIAAESVPDRPADTLFRLPIDRVFTIRGTGTVVTGTVWSGVLARDATVQILPAGLDARVRGLQVHGETATQVHAGQRAAVALAGIERGALSRGDALVEPGPWLAASILTARIHVLPDTGWSLRHRQRVRLHLGTAEVMGRVVLYDRRELAPAQEDWCQLRLERPVLARAGDRFVLRSYSPVTTIAGGTVAEPAASKRKTLRPVVRQALADVLGDDGDAGLRALAGLAGWQGIERASIGVALPRGVQALRRALEGSDDAAPSTIGGRVFTARTLDEARRLVLDAVARHHQQAPLDAAVPRDVVRRALPARAPADLADHVTATLLAEGALVARDNGLALPDFRPRLTNEQQAASERLLQLLRDGGLAPPTLSELPDDLMARPDFAALLAVLERQGDIIGIDREIYLDAATLIAARGAVRSRLAGRTDLGPADFREVLPLSRKYLIPLLQHFDATGVTIRRGEARAVPIART
jgi:selenocysteine-specific elongation factor